MDIDAVDALKVLFDIFPELPVSGLDIFGDGTCRRELEEYVVHQGLEDQIHFMGWCSELYDRLDGKYNGIMGQGRVALEGLIMGYPVLEMGRGKICGLLEGNIFQLAKKNNFVANLLPQFDTSTIIAQLEMAYDHPEQFDHRQEMVDTFNISTIANEYIERLSTLSMVPRGNVVSWYEAVKSISNQAEKFYFSQDVFRTMVQHIKHYVIDRNILDLFIMGNNCIELKNEIGLIQGLLASQTQKLEKVDHLMNDQKRFDEYWQEQMQTLAQILEQSTQSQIKYNQIMEQHTQILIQLTQMQEQIESHRKTLLPLLWISKRLSKLKELLHIKSSD